MAAQRPKRNNSPVNAKLQPLKATVPLSSLVRNPSPARRRTCPPSPSLPPDVRNRLRRSPDVSHGDHRTIVSPHGSEADILKPVINREENVHQTSSLEALSSSYANSYINGQWPRYSGTAAVSQPCQGFQHPSVHQQLPAVLQHSPSLSSYLSNKFTQTPPHWDDGGDEQAHPVLGHKRSSSFGNADSKEKIRQCLQRTKHSHSIHEKQSPIQADHLLQYFSGASNFKPSKPLDIPPRVPSSPKHTSLHTRKSVEGLNIELEGLDLDSKDDAVFAKTPPEGRRPPVPGIDAKLVEQAKNVDTHTQTGDGWIDNNSSTAAAGDQRSLSASPSWPVPVQHRSPCKESPQSARSLSADSAVPEHGSPEAAAHVPKFAPSPKPNNTYMFARGPPDGAEKVPLNIEEIESAKYSSYSCPDTSKCAIKFSADSPFYSLPSQPKVLLRPGYS